MRLTLRIDDRLLQNAKTLADQTGRTLTEVVEGALREFLNRHQKPKMKARVQLTTVSGKGLRNGVNLDHSSELFDYMDQTHASD